MNLPETFKKQMTELLGDEAADFFSSYDEPRHSGYRLNHLKTENAVRSQLEMNRERVPWCSEGVYFGEDERPSKHPYYAAGAYYIQEPSAMSPVAALKPRPGELVADLCAAPGGKSTQIASALRGDGLLLCNDISYSRATSLNRNLQMNGVTNAVVMGEDPVKLAESFFGIFDRVLVDAPCSGEGMFRKDPKLIASWQETGPETFVEVQRQIMTAAYKMLKPGGCMVYSTCTYNTTENEENIHWFLMNHGGTELIPLAEMLKVSEGIPLDGHDELKACARIWPHRHRGEGHFIAAVRKPYEAVEINWKTLEPTVDRETVKAIEEFAGSIGLKASVLPLDRLNRVKDTVYLLPEKALDVKGLRTLANGWLLGIMKKNRFEPSQAFASGLSSDNLNSRIELTVSDENVIRYLKGETIHVEAPNGWQLVTLDGMGIGWGKVLDKRLKNKLEPSWRWM